MRHHVEEPRVRTAGERVGLQMEKALIHGYPGASASISLGGLRLKSRFRRPGCLVSATPPDHAITARVGSLVNSHTSRSVSIAVSLYSNRPTMSSPRAIPDRKRTRLNSSH